MSFSTLRVPASSANLGPGFDALGLALGIYLQCRFRPADRLTIRARGRDAGSIPTTESNLIWQTALAVAGDTGETIHPIELEIDNDIPLGKGLGSSAAALTAAIVASAIDSGGVARAVRLELPPKYSIAVVVPDFDLPTSHARSVLPESYSRADAVFNVQRSALLIAALITGTTSAFPTALEDRIHQPYRASLVPGLEQILRLRAPGL
ncbi:MAG: homoserine kinase, partial [Acidobacteria bacterium]|nr:homoserine kinase [Acidobacteriota bacterium]